MKKDVEEYQRKITIESAISKLDLEVTSRLDNYHNAIMESHSISGVLKASAVLDKHSVFPEFERFTLKALIWQITQNEPNADHQDDLRFASDGVDRINELTISTEFLSGKPIKEIQDDILHDFVSRYFNIRGWLRYSFSKSNKLKKPRL